MTMASPAWDCSSFLSFFLLHARKGSWEFRYARAGASPVLSRVLGMVDVFFFLHRAFHVFLFWCLQALMEFLATKKKEKWEERKTLSDLDTAGAGWDEDLNT
jgi:hypothetical protein